MGKFDLGVPVLDLEGSREAQTPELHSLKKLYVELLLELLATLHLGEEGSSPP